MKEHAVIFGAHRHLIGVVTRPESDDVRPTRAVIMSNVGTHHRVGPFRLYVDLAREFAAAGYLALRFDLAGHGDSEPRPGTLGVAESMAADLTEAIQWLAEQYGVESVVLVGLCSGVDSTHSVAVADERVSGAVFIDGYTYPTWRYYPRRYVLRYLAPERWRRFIARRLRRVHRQLARSEPAAASAIPLYSRAYPPREMFRRDIALLTGRGVRLLFVYTGSGHLYYNSRGQIFEQLDGRARREMIDVEYVPEADHLFSRLAHRRRLLARLRAWA